MFKNVSFRNLLSNIMLEQEKNKCQNIPEQLLTRT